MATNEIRPKESFYKDQQNLTGNVFEDMAKFDQQYGFVDVEMTSEFLAFRMRFLMEELFEAIEACENGNAENFVDAMIDLIVVAAGTLSIGKVDAQKAWNEVRRANMSKIRKDNPTRQGSGGADLIKPEGWIRPNHLDNVGEFADAVGYEFSEHFSHSVTVLFEAMAMQFKKNADYDSKASGIKRADYFPRGLDDLYYELNKKHLRFKSVLDKLRESGTVEYESLEDTSQDIINYQSFVIALLRGRLEGQSLSRDVFGRLK